MDVLASQTPRPVIVLGDGQIQCIKRAARNFLFLPRNVETVEVGGATAIANRNPNAPVDAVAKYRAALEGTDKASIIVIQIGEADCGYVIWHRAEKDGEPVQAQLDEAVAAYFACVDELIGQGFTEIIITGATLPTIDDADQAAGLVTRRSDIAASQQARTELTLAYNVKLKAGAEQRNLAYVDIAGDVLDPETGLADPAYRNASPTDPQMHYQRAGANWALRLNDALQLADPVALPVTSLRARLPSFVKASAELASALPADLKLPAAPGDTLLGRLNGKTGDAWVISDAVLNGVALDRRLRIVHAAHWEVLPEPALPVPDAPEPGVPAPDSPEPVVPVPELQLAPPEPELPPPPQAAIPLLEDIPVAAMLPADLPPPEEMAEPEELPPAIAPPRRTRAHFLRDKLREMANTVMGKT